MSNLNLPNFMIIGAPKCGTTTLHHLLSQHPEIYLPKAKETHFFDLDYQYEKGVNFYLKTYYSNKKPHQSLIGDATPSYLRFPTKVIPRIKSTVNNDQIKFLIMLRDPVQRAWSHYLHSVRIAEEVSDFETALTLEEKRLDTNPEKWVGYFNDGLYSNQIKPWFNAFPKENFKIYTLQDLKENPSDVLRDCLTFLGANLDYTDIDFAKQNFRQGMKSPSLMHVIRGKFKGAQQIKKLIPFHVRRVVVDRLISLNTKAVNEEDSKLDPNIANHLRDKYRPSIEDLELVLGRDFSQWK